MPEADFIIAPRWIIPVEPAGQILTDHVAVIGSGRIITIQERANAAEAWPAAEWVERPEHVLLPGFINAHTHGPMTLLRGYADDLPLQQWLSEYIWPAEARWANAEFARDGADLAILEMIRGGTTCFHDMYLFPDEICAVAAERGIRAVVSMIVIEAPTAWATEADEYINRGLEVHDRYRDHPLVKLSFGPHAPYTVSNEPLQRISTLANQLDVPIQMHVHETADEVQQAVTDTGVRPLERLDKLGMLNPLLNAVHMTELNPEEIILLTERGVHVVHCPESNMKLASGFCPVTELMQAGVNVALGTDGTASNNDLDMLGEMRSAALLAKAHSGDASAVNAAEALSMATLNGAKALGMETETGSLVPGKSADMVCISLAALACQPVHNALSAIVYSATRDQVSDVWVAGRQLLAEGVLQTADEQEVLARTAAWFAKMHAEEDT
ncbi:MAG: TRZ/ATZ family hydrolase [Gammaproteobacteria bacterium]|jgi:5-methylthioadenosine/S-adenosylhomocysteine deaminase|nr:TRZ/ATZ family hydrolase [Gammaproteobacteria bacterium]MDP6616070.1 TRZ/ATZ family hydrolase [Gammaproteobacteria bacterium]MDP6695327.1 TRZ/ATZ family hydrolase [Gammaproteobacteria bacterium]